MLDAKGIVNLALGHLGNYSITTLENAVTPIEKRMAQFYEHWRDAELLRGRWAFAVGFSALTLHPGAPDVTAERPYGYYKPNDYLGPVNTRDRRWVVRGDRLYSPYPTQILEYIKRVPETQFSPLFDAVLAARIALENAEWVTQSNTKKADMERLYNKARVDAVAGNALIIDDDETATVRDEDDEWIRARAGYYL